MPYSLFSWGGMLLHGGERGEEENRRLAHFSGTMPAHLSRWISTDAGRGEPVKSEEHSEKGSGKKPPSLLLLERTSILTSAS